AGGGGRGGGGLPVARVGLGLEAGRWLRGGVLMGFGPPVPLAPHAVAYREDAAKAIDALTTRIQWAMEAQVVHADRVDTAELARAVEELYGGELVRRLQIERGLQPREVDPFRLSRAIAAAV